MIAWFVGSGLRLGNLVVAAAAAILVLGIPLVANAPVETYPEFTPTTVEVQTESLGLSATEVESLVTVPLEQDLLNGVPWVDQISSRSIPGLSAIDLVFKAGTDEAAARQLVQERMTQIRALPNVGTPPVMMQPLASTGRVSMIGLSPSAGSSLSLIDLSVLARWKIRPRLMGVPGVANVAIYGQRDRQLQVQADPVRMAARQVSLTDVTTTAANALWVSPLSFVQASTPGTGGFVESPNQRLAVQHILPISSAADLAAVPVTGPHPGVKLGDVADVVTDHQPLVGDAVTAGASSLVLVVERFPGANTEEVTRGVEQALDALRPGLAGIDVDAAIYRPATYLDAATHNLGIVGAIGLGLVILVLLVLSGSWRVTVVTVGVVLLSLVAAAGILALARTTFTSMTLVGLAAALAILVDDVVTDVDGVTRQLRRSEDQSRSGRLAAVTSACVRSRGLLGATLLVLPVLTAPVLFLPPFQASFSRPLVIGYLVAVAVSALVALLVTPTVCVLLLRGAPRRGSPILRALVRGYQRLLGRLLRVPRSTLLAGAVLAVAGAVCVPAVVTASALPVLKDPNLLVHLRSMPGTSLSEMDRITSAMGNEIRGVNGVADVGTHVGRAVMSDEAVDVNSSELWVSLDPAADYDRTRARLDAVVSGYPGLATRVSTYTADQLASGRQDSRTDVIVRVFGNDLAVLQSTARQVQVAVRGVPGVGAATVAVQQSQPAAQVVVDLQAAAKYGLRPGDVRRQATTMMSGLLVGNLYENQAVFDVVVQGPPNTTHSLTSLGDLRIDLPTGTQVALRDVAAVRLGPEPTVIRHQGVSRATDVAVSLTGTGPSDMRSAIEAAVRDVAMPPEFHAEVVVPEGSPLAPNRGWQPVAMACAVVILLLLQAATGSWRIGAGLVLALGLSASAGLAATALVGATSSVGTLAGLLVGLALTARQSVVLVRDAQSYEPSEGSVRTRVATAAGKRAAPLVLIIVTLLAAFTPVLLAAERPGLELLRPFAAAAVGSLVGTILAALFLVPALTLLTDTARQPARAAGPPRARRWPVAVRPLRWRRS
jgi:Cu/Ag efflux pump CusA